ncbi:SDR family NAD(P)-dependent oxidoreductase [Streptomyces sp. M19]
MGAAEEMTVEQVRDQVETLLLAPILITRAFLKPMREQGGGRIIQVTSMGGQVGAPAHSAYHAGKWGLEGTPRASAAKSPTSASTSPSSNPAAPAPASSPPCATPPSRPTTAAPRRRHAAVAGELRRGHPPRRPGPGRRRRLRHHPQPRPAAAPDLGGDAYDAVHAALTERLAALEAQRDVALSVAFTG